MSSYVSIPISLTLKKPTILSPLKLEEWIINSGFKFEGSVDFLEDDSKACEINLFIGYWLFFHHNLLIEAGIPAFKPSTVLKFEDLNGDDFQVSMNLYSLEDFKPLVVQALSKCLPFLVYMNETDFKWSHFEVLSLRLYSELYLPLKKASNSGLSSIPLLSYAYRNNVPYYYLGLGVYQIGWGANSHLLHKSSTDEDSYIGASLSGYKYFTAQRLNLLGLPSGKNRLVDQLDKAIDYAQEIHYPVVIKPEQGNRGEGVVKDISSDEQLSRAWDVARKHNRLILVEKQVKGTSYRFFVYKGEVLYVNGNLPRSLCGDGVATVTQLIAEENSNQKKRTPWKRDPELELDSEMLSCLSEQQLKPDSIVAKNKSIYVRKIASIEWGSAFAPAITDIHPDNLRLAVDAASAMKLCSAGVDVIIEDLSCAWHEQECIITEVNSSPMIGVSEASISSVPKLMDLMLDSDGRIPISVFIGQEEAFKQALELQKVEIDQGRSCFLTSHDFSYDGSQKRVPMVQKNLASRVLAMLMNQSVDSLIIVVQTDEVLKDRLAIDRVERIKDSGESIRNLVDESNAVKANQAVLEYFNGMLESRDV